MSASSRYRSLRGIKRRFDAAATLFAWYVGWLGLFALVGCIVLRILPGAVWDGLLGLSAESWPTYAMVSLIVAGLLGFNIVNRGQDRIKKRIGRALSMLFFAIIPLACLAASLWPLYAEDAAIDGHPAGTLWLFVRWYPPVVTMICAAVFLAWKAKPRKNVYFERGLGYAFLLAPYALLFATLELGVQLNWLDDSRRETLTALGSAAIVIQVVLAFFISSSD